MIFRKYFTKLFEKNYLQLFHFLHQIYFGFRKFLQNIKFTASSVFYIITRACTMVYCCICKSSGTKGYFSFPTGSRRSDWLDRANLPKESDLEVKIKSLRVCFRHFQVNDLLVVGKHVRISKGE